VSELSGAPEAPSGEPDPVRFILILMQVHSDTTVSTRQATEGIVSSPFERRLHDAVDVLQQRIDGRLAPRCVRGGPPIRPKARTHLAFPQPYEVVQ
jgi:hypothetical protein